MRNMLVCLVAIFGLGLGQPPGGGVTAAQAAPFLGDWTVSTSSAALGAQTYQVAVPRSGEAIRATVKAESQPAVNVSDIRVSGKSLVLAYAASYPGMAIPTVLILTPDGGSLRADLSIMDGQLEMSGTATKGGAAAASPRPAAQGGQPGGRGGPPAQRQVARVTDLMQMMAALPDTAPAKPAKPRRVLVLARAAGFVHAS